MSKKRSGWRSRVGTGQTADDLQRELFRQPSISIPRPGEFQTEGTPEERFNQRPQANVLRDIGDWLGGLGEAHEQTMRSEFGTQPFPSPSGRLGGHMVTGDEEGFGSMMPVDPSKFVSSPATSLSSSTTQAPDPREGREFAGYDESSGYARWVKRDPTTGYIDPTDVYLDRSDISEDVLQSRELTRAQIAKMQQDATSGAGHAPKGWQLVPDGKGGFIKFNADTSEMVEMPAGNSYHIDEWNGKLIGFELDPDGKPVGEIEVLAKAPPQHQFFQTEEGVYSGRIDPDTGTFMEDPKLVIPIKQKPVFMATEDGGYRMIDPETGDVLKEVKGTPKVRVEGGNVIVPEGMSTNIHYEEPTMWEGWKPGQAYTGKGQDRGWGRNVGSGQGMDPMMMGMDPSMMGGMDPSMMGMDPSMMGGGGGGWQLPVPEGSVEGMGNRFGQPVSDEGIHKGTDIQAVEGTPVVAPFNGRVVDVQYDKSGLGLNVTIQDEMTGEKVKLSHMGDMAVQVGDEVKAGDHVGMVGSTGNSTGPHLDVREQTPDGQYMNPEDKLPPDVRSMGLSPNTVGAGQDNPWSDFWGEQQRLKDAGRPPAPPSTFLGDLWGKSARPTGAPRPSNEPPEHIAKFLGSRGLGLIPAAIFDKLQQWAPRPGTMMDVGMGQARGWGRRVGMGAASDGQTLADQPPQDQANFIAEYGDNAESAWEAEHNAAIGGSQPSSGDGEYGPGEYISPDTKYSIDTEAASAKASLDNQYAIVQEQLNAARYQMDQQYQAEMKRLEQEFQIHQDRMSYERETRDLQMQYQTETRDLEIQQQDMARDFQAAQAELQRAWEGGEAEKIRQFQAGESEVQRKWETAESAAQRQWQTQERLGTQDWQAQQSELSFNRQMSASSPWLSALSGRLPKWGEAGGPGATGGVGAQLAGAGAMPGQTAQPPQGMSYEQFSGMSPYEMAAMRYDTELGGTPWGTAAQQMREGWGQQGITDAPNATYMQAAGMSPEGVEKQGMIAETFGYRPQDYWSKQEKGWGRAKASNVTQAA